MKRYRVCIKNAKECRTELPFPDLQVTFSNGYHIPLKVKEGSEILFDLLDPEDIRKSWIVGSLKGYFENGWIQEIPEDLTIKEAAIPISQFITEQMVLAPKIEPIKIVEQPTQLEVPPQSNLPEVKEVEQTSSVIQNDPITDLNLVASHEEFNRLSHFLKLRFIKESQNIDLLRQIQTLTTSSQFKNNIQLRLSQIKN